jgi:hypothetical protein
MYLNTSRKIIYVCVCIYVYMYVSMYIALTHLQSFCPDSFLEYSKTDLKNMIKDCYL